MLATATREVAVLSKTFQQAMMLYQANSEGTRTRPSVMMMDMTLAFKRPKSKRNRRQTLFMTSLLPFRTIARAIAVTLVLSTAEARIARIHAGGPLHVRRGAVQVDQARVGEAL